MIYLNKIYLNQYIYSPVTKYHKINKYTMVFTVYNTLIIILYLSINKIIVITIALFLIIIWSRFSKDIKFVTLNTIINNLLYLVHTLILNHLIGNRPINSQHIVTNNLIVPFKVQVNLNNTIYKLEYYHIIYFIPKHLIKLFLIYISYYNLIQILFTFTKSQIVIENLVNYFNLISRSIKIRYNKSIINLYLGYQSLENIMCTWINNSIGQKMKGKYIISKQKIYNILILTKYYNYLLCEENNNSFILWNRDIVYDDFINIQYYY